MPSVEILLPEEGINLNLENLNKLILEEVTKSEKRASLNTFLSNLNEIYLCFFLAGSWENVDRGENLRILVTSESLVDQKLKDEQIERAKVMAQKVLEWSTANGFEGSVQRTFWTNTPLKLKSAIGSSVSSGNPSDVLIKFSDDSFLGVSAKSTKSSGDIGFKNPGMGALSKKLGVDLNAYVSSLENEAVAKYNLPISKKERKPFIRANPEINVQTEKVGELILKNLRDALLAHYKSMQLEDVRTHIMSVWLDAKEAFPYYVKVTGRGSFGGKYDADVYDPIKNEKFKSLSADPITFEAVGTNSIGVKVGDMKIFKIRFKYESEKLASSIKLSGDPW